MKKVAIFIFLAVFTLSYSARTQELNPNEVKQIMQKVLASLGALKFYVNNAFAQGAAFFDNPQTGAAPSACGSVCWETSPPLMATSATPTSARR